MKMWLFVLALGSVAAQADHHMHHATSPSGHAQIIVTINPEARVSAVLGEPLPSPSACGSATELKIQVINQGFITAPLRASIVGDSTQHVALQMEVTRLSGQREDSRALRLIPLGVDIVDVTIAFSIDHNIGDLGGRDRVHFVLRCNVFLPTVE